MAASSRGRKVWIRHVSALAQQFNEVESRSVLSLRSIVVAQHFLSERQAKQVSAWPSHQPAGQDFLAQASWLDARLGAAIRERRVADIATDFCDHIRVSRAAR